MTKKISCLTWIKPTGDWMHLWNYIWMFEPLLDLSKNKKSYLMVADLHALTSVHSWDIMQKNKIRMLAEIIALLPEDSDIILFEQSEIKHLNDISWVLNSVTPYSLMLRAHSFKDSKNKNSDINMATFNYPILMAADIITYDIDVVPVWKDQKQHLEFARDIAGYFNKTYKTEIFKLPDSYIKEDTWLVIWTDGRKMSKSYDNFLWIFDDEKKLKKKIMSIVTDDKALEEPKDPETCNVFAIIKLLASKNKQEEIKKKYLAWNYGYWHAKLELLEIFLDYFKDARQKYQEILQNPNIIKEKLKVWNEVLNEKATKKYEEIMKLVWLN